MIISLLHGVYGIVLFYYFMSESAIKLLHIKILF